jgi:hypothetical protein
MAFFGPRHYRKLIATLCDRYWQDAVTEEPIQLESFMACLAKMFQEDNPGFKKPVFWHQFHERLQACQNEAERAIEDGEVPWWLQDKEI